MNVSVFRAGPRILVARNKISIVTHRHVYVSDELKLEMFLTCITAQSVVRLWCMARQTYRTIITNKSKKKREQLMGFLKT